MRDFDVARALLLDALYRLKAQALFWYFGSMVRPVGLILGYFFLFDGANIAVPIFIEILLSTYGVTSSSILPLKRFSSNFRLTVRAVLGYIAIKILVALSPLFIVLNTLVIVGDRGLPFSAVVIISAIAFALAFGLFIGVVSVRYRDARRVCQYFVSGAALVALSLDDGQIIWVNEMLVVWYLSLAFALVYLILGFRYQLSAVVEDF